ncbi:MAG: hypothetical protein NVSMB42_26450 [Herpetosiphon sp.]
MHRTPSIRMMRFPGLTTDYDWIKQPECNVARGIASVTPLPLSDR